MHSLTHSEHFQLAALDTLEFLRGRIWPLPASGRVWLLGVLIKRIAVVAVGVAH